MFAKVLRGREERVLRGHPWVFRSDVTDVSAEATPGDIVDVLNARGQFLGKALYNPNSQITLRMLTRLDEKTDDAFFARRVQEAWDFRSRFCDINSCRVINAEADRLPGLIVDKFADVLVMQSLSLGIDQRKESIARALMEITGAKGVYERSDVPVRRLEGLEQRTGFLLGEFDTTVEMIENGIHFLVDVANGQKTGFFLDQKENRAAIAPVVKGATVLDCFCHTGSFALHAAKYGAKEVVGIDISPEALDMARKNAELNKLENVRFEEHNVFDLLHTLNEQNAEYDCVILDPPAFTKSRQMVESALRGYKQINLRAMRMIRPGGFLITCSCSQHVSPEQFMEMCVSSARDVKRTLRIVENRTQGKDHPILAGVPETQYLKCLIFQVW